MMTAKKTLVVQAALAGIFSMAMTTSAQTDPAAPATKKAAPAKKSAEKVHCFGINSCKGKSECAVDGKSSCHGQNACKGQGWISLSRKTCAKKKGTVVGTPASMAPVASETK